MGIILGIAQDFDTSETSRLFKYTVSTYSGLASLVDVQEGDIAWVQTYSLLTPTRFTGAYQYLSGAWVYGSKELQDQVNTNIAEIAANEADIAVNVADIAANAANIAQNSSDISDLEADVLTIFGDITNLENTKLDSIQAGANITVDNTDPLNPIISSSGAGSGPFLNPTLVLTCAASVDLNTVAGEIVPFNVVGGRNSIPGVAFLGNGTWQLPAGQYRMGYKINGDNQTNARKNPLITIRKNGIQELDYTAAYTYARNLTDNFGSHSIPMIDDFLNMNLVGGENFQLVSFLTGSAGAYDSIPNECVWIIEKIA